MLSSVPDALQQCSAYIQLAEVMCACKAIVASAAGAMNLGNSCLTVGEPKHQTVRFQ